jgi:hypothetical protein
MTSAFAITDPVQRLNEKAISRGWTFACDRDLRFEAPKLSDVLELWKKHANGGKIPARSDFSARDLLRVLPVLMIAQIVRTDGRERYRYRYVGTQAAQTIGELTGKMLDEALPEPARERTTECYKAIVEARGPLRFVTKFSLDQISYLSAEFLSAPLACDGTTIDMVMTVTDFCPPQ